jgi:hypothetical protein
MLMERRRFVGRQRTGTWRRSRHWHSWARTSLVGWSTERRPFRPASAEVTTRRRKCSESSSAARAQQAAARERARQAAEQDMAEKREAADRVAAELLEEEEREQAAQTKVRVAPPSPHIGLHSVQLGGERCVVSVARVSVSPLTA